MANKSIDTKVNRILKKRGVSAPPVDIESIAKAYGVQIVRDELEDDVSGFLVRKNQNTYIGVNSIHHPNRQRFTIAHELGHYFLHLTPERSLFVDRSAVYFRDSDSSLGSVSQEMDANAFAANILMPYALIEDALAALQGELDDISIFKLANQFRVSDQAMRYRLANAGIITST